MNRPKLTVQGGLRAALLLLCVAGSGQLRADEAQKKAPDQEVPAATEADAKPVDGKAGDAKPVDDKDKAKDKQPSPAAKVVALVGGRVATMSSAGVIEGATVLITGDVITAVGTDVEIPDSATRIDVSGMTVSPGLIDVRSSLWLARDSVSASASDGSLKAVDGVDAYSDSWIEVARQGVTAVSVQPSGALGGESVVLRVAPASSVAELVIKETAAVQASLGLSGSTGNSRDRYLQYEALKKTLTAAKTYKEEWEKYEAAVKKAAEKPEDKDKPATEKKPEASAADANAARPTPGGRPGFGGGRGGVRGPGGSRDGRGRPPGEPEKPAEEDAKKETPSTSASTTTATGAGEKKPELPKKPKRDPVKDLLVRVLNKEVPLRLEAHRADDVANAFQLAKDFELTFVFEGLTQAGRSWATLDEQHPPVVAGPFIQFESTPSYASSDADRYEDLSKVDGLLAIGSFSRDDRGSRLIRFHAASAVAAGLSPDKAMRAITIDAAKVLGIDASTGSIETGKHADIVVVGGDPLNPAAPVMLTMSHGEIVFQAADAVPSVSHHALVEVPAITGSLPADFALVSEQIVYPDGTIAPGAVLVKAGQITGVTTAKAETGDLPVFDMGSAVISPGLIVAHVSEIDVATTDAVASQIRAIDSFSPDSSNLRKLSEAGFTSAMFSPDSRCVISGQIGCVRFHSATQVLMDKAQPVLPAAKFVLAADSRSTARYPASLSGQLSLLNKYFSGEQVSFDLYIPEAARRLLTAQHDQLLASLKDKSTVAVMEAGSSPEVEAAISLIRSHGLQALILHPEDLHTSIAALQEVGAGLIVRTSRITDHDWYAHDIAAASNTGMKVSVSGDDPIKLRQTLAMLVNAGMTPEAALRSVTSDAADSFRLTTIGKLATGSAADIVIWNGSPINPAARPIYVIVDGRLTKDAQ